MADVENVKQGLKYHCSNRCGDDNKGLCLYWGNDHCSQQLCNDALSVIEEQQAEIERLEQENVDLKLAVQIMPNWLNEKRPEVVHCPDCLYQKNCISTQSGIEPDGFCKWGKKDGDGE